VFVRTDIFVTVKITITVARSVASCILSETYERLRGTYCLHVKGRIHRHEVGGVEFLGEV